MKKSQLKKLIEAVVREMKHLPAYVYKHKVKNAEMRFSTPQKAVDWLRKLEPEFRVKDQGMWQYDDDYLLKNYFIYDDGTQPFDLERRVRELEKNKYKGVYEDLTTRGELDAGLMKAVNVEENEFDGKQAPVHNAKISNAEMEEAKNVAYKIWQPVYLTQFHSIDRLGGKHFVVYLHSATGDKHYLMKDKSGKWLYSTGHGEESRWVSADEYLNEMTTTGAVAGYSTPFAFTKNKKGSKRALDASKKIGYTPTGIDEDKI